MRKRLTKAEKWLFASPLLFLIPICFAWQSQPLAPEALELPDPGNIESMEFSPDSKHLVALSQFTDSVVPIGRVYDVESRSVVSQFDTPSSLAKTWPTQSGPKSYRYPAWSNDGTRIAANIYRSQNNPKRIGIWDAKSGKVEADYNYPPDKHLSLRGPLHFSDDDKTLIGDYKSTPVFEVATGKLLKKVDFSDGRIWRVKAEKGQSNKNQEDEEWKVSYDRDKEAVRVIDSRTKRLIWDFRAETLSHYRWYGDVLCIHDIQFIPSPEPTDVHRLRLWSARSRQLLKSPPLFAGATNVDFAFNPDGQTLVVFSGKATSNWLGKSFAGELMLWDYRQNRVVWRNRFSEVLGNFEWSSDGEWLAVLAGQPPKTLWHVFDKNGNLRIKDKTNTYFIRFSPDSKKLAKYVVELNKMNDPQSSHIEIIRLKDE